MQLVNVDDIPLITRETVRADRMDYKRLLAGTPGTLGNFKLVFATTYAGYNGPRHRHNFDQIKLQFEGDYKHFRIGKMTGGMVGYFPEGTFYGPFTSSEKAVVLLLQFGGASGAGYMSDEEYIAAMTQLKTQGEYADGLYMRVDPNGKRVRKDGYEATWEHAYKRKLSYPPTRYTEPVLMRPENFTWVSESEGGSYKLLGDFTERGTRIGFVRIERGASVELAGNSVYYVMGGSGSIGGRSWHTGSAMHLDPHEALTAMADEPSELFHMRLPRFGVVPVERPRELVGATGGD